MYPKVCFCHGLAPQILLFANFEWASGCVNSQVEDDANVNIKAALRFLRFNTHVDKCVVQNYSETLKLQHEHDSDFFAKEWNY